MQVTLLFFAAARDAVGRSKDVVELPAQVDNVARLTAWLCGEYPSLEPYIDCVRIAQNEHFVEASTAIQAGDILAVIPPVAGG
jgi:molybdopterin synthase sulfur carrier subunit